LTTCLFRLSKEGQGFGLLFDVPAVASDAADGPEGVTIDRQDSPRAPGWC
jgi:hypothetical protein